MTNRDGASRVSQNSAHTAALPSHQARVFAGEMRAGVWLMLSALFCAASSPAAQEAKRAELGGMGLEDLAKMKVESVYGASKFLQQASDAPAVQQADRIFAVIAGVGTKLVQDHLLGLSTRCPVTLMNCPQILPAPLFPNRWSPFLRFGWVTS